MGQRYKRIDYCLKNIQSMINDQKRNLFYKDLIREKVKDKVVVDVGFGTGLLSFLSIESGAKKVIAYEQNPELYLLGLKIVRSLGLEEKIELINDRFTTKHLNGSEDIIVHEIFSEDLWGEYLFYSLKNSPIPIIPNIYRCEAFIRKADEKEIKYTNFTKECKNVPYHFNPGILSHETVNIKKNVIEEELLTLSKEMPITLIPRNSIDFNHDWTNFFDYEIDTNKIDIPKEINMDISIPIGEYMIYFKYSFGDETRLFETTSNYRGKSWDQFEEVGNPVKLTVLCPKITFHQSLINGDYYFNSPL